MRDVVTSQTAALLGEAWEGHYFWRGFVDSGNPLAPQLFFVEPQVFPVLADIVGPDRRDLALGEVVRRLETPIGAITNVAIGVQGPVGGIDQPQVGGVWPVANAWLTAAYARRDPLEAWSSFTRNTLSAHAQAYPALWYGIWTGPDSWNGADKPRPGEADAHIATALTDYPALNAHVHTSPLRALTDLVGVEGTRDGLRITPRVPTETFTVRWPRLSIESVPAAIAGALTTAATEPLMLEVLLPSGLRGGVPLAVIAGGAPAAYTLDGDVVRFALPPAPGAPVAWRIAATP
jgi:hypothetical protein